MKKRLLLGFICAVILFILVISKDDNFAQIVVPFLGPFSERDITCYNEASDINGLPEFEASRGIWNINFKYIIITLVILIFMFELRVLLDR